MRTHSVAARRWKGARAIVEKVDGRGRPAERERGHKDPTARKAIKGSFYGISGNPKL